MASTQGVPEGFRVYVFHGMTLETSGEDQGRGECPFCEEGREFYCRRDNGLWKCFRCKETGNPGTWMRLLWERSLKATRDEDYERLSLERGLLYPESLVRWGCARSIIDATWIVPMWSLKGLFLQVARYIKVATGKRTLNSTPNQPTGLYGPWGSGSFSPGESGIVYCEGPWDGMALEEVMMRCKRGEHGLEPTNREEDSLLKTIAVCAVPAAGTFQDSWTTLADDKDASIFFDSDHPKEDGKEGGLAGWKGTQRTARILTEKGRPRSVFYLHWGPEGYDPSLPSGYDVRDALKEGEDLRQRANLLHALMGRVLPIPAEWSAKGVAGGGAGESSLTPEVCESWDALIEDWKQAMVWSEGLDRVFSIMMSSCLSVSAIPDEQLWVRVISPASSGKTTLCEALAVAKDWVYSVSTFRGFHSGYKTDREGKEDHSLLPKIIGKTLVTKDGDAVLTIPNLSQLMGEGRDIYDGVARVDYRHGVRKESDYIPMTWLICGTESLRNMDTSELGERFIDTRIMTGIDEKLERFTALQAADNVFTSMRLKSNCQPESRHRPEVVKAKRRTAGYVDYLRRNAHALLNSVQMGAGEREQVVDCATFIAYLRARPSGRQGEIHAREVCIRLAKQLMRLAVCLACVMGKDHVDDEVMRRVRWTALDTVQGKTLKLVRNIWEGEREGGLTYPEVCQRTPGIGMKSEVRKLMNFLLGIRAIHARRGEEEYGVRGEVKYELTPTLKRVYEVVTQGQEHRIEE
jgi:hypothetical protein